MSNIAMSREVVPAAFDAVCAIKRGQSDSNDTIKRSCLALNVEAEDEKIEGEKEPKKCVIKEIQRDPVSGKFLHVDFLGVRMGEKITVTVPLVLNGTPAGVKSGGIMEHLIRELEIECFPRHLPEKLEVDVSNLEIGDSIHVSNLKFENMAILDDPDSAVVVIEAPRVVVEEVEEAVEEEMPTEPEVISEKKPGEEGAEEGKSES